MSLVNGIDPILTEQWAKEGHLIFDEEDFGLEDTYVLQEGPNKVFHFPVWGNGTAVKGRQRHQDVLINTEQTDDVTVTPQLIETAYLIDEWELFQTSTNYREMMHRKASGDVRRQMKADFITALETSTNSEVTLPTANTFNYAGAVHMGKVLDNNAVSMENRFGLLNPGAFEDVLNDTTAINNFHFSNDAVATGRLKGIAGFEFREAIYLSNGAGGSGERRCFVWQKDAVVAGQNMPFKVRVGWREDKQAWQYYACVQIAWAIRDHKGVQFFDVTETA